MVTLEKSDTIVCVEWFTQCNLKCDFCYNFLNNDIESNKQGNFDIVPHLNNLPGNKIFMEAGGEMLLAPYFLELMEYKQKTINNYKGVLFTNGEIITTKFTNIVNGLYSKNINTDLCFSPHFENNTKLKFLEENIIYYYNVYGFVYINLVVIEDVELYMSFLEKLTQMPIDNVHINISFDFKIFNSFNKKSYNKMQQLKTKVFIKSFKPLYDYIKEHFIVLNYGRGIIKNKFEEVLNVFELFDNNKLNTSSYNPSVAVFVNYDEVEIHIENKVVTMPINELGLIIHNLHIDNSDVSPSEILTFSICNF